MSSSFATLPGINNIYCPDKTCTNSRDWLVSKPIAVPLWVLGSLFTILGIVHFCRRPNSYNKRSTRFSLGLSMVVFGLSMFLRAAITQGSGGNKTAMYIASIIFNYSSGTTLCGLQAVNYYLVSNDFQPQPMVQGRLHLLKDTVLGFGIMALYIAGTVLMFHPHGSAIYTGLRCTQIALGFFLAILVLNSAVYIYYMKTICAHLSVYRRLLLVVLTFLGFIWAGYMFARTFVQVDNPAHGSEVMFFLLNYLPIMIGMILVVVFDYPLRKKADEPQYETNDQKFPGLGSFESPNDELNLIDNRNGLYLIPRPDMK